MANAAMAATGSFGGRRPGRRSREREARSKSCSSRLPEHATMWTRTRAVELQGHSADQTERKQLSETVSHEQWYWSSTRVKRADPQRVKRADPQRVKRAYPQRVRTRQIQRDDELSTETARCFSSLAARHWRTSSRILAHQGEVWRWLELGRSLHSCTTAIHSMGGPVTQYCAGRIDSRRWQ